MNKLYIPKTIKVGYQKRSDCFTGQLAYIIYTDDKGVLRKQKSWESWRDKKIEPSDFDNTPISGFVLNKDIKRYNWSHFSSNRTMIRVHDSRGFEFELTTENLIAILMNTNCSHRALEGDFVYAWHGTELVLLPTVCEEYNAATQHTELQGKDVSARDLIEGINYLGKDNKNYIYIGRYHWYEYKADGRYNYNSHSRAAKKYHIFYSEESKGFITKNDVKFLSCATSEDKVTNFASLFEKFQKNTHSSKIVGYRLGKCEFDPTVTKQSYYARLKKDHYYCLEEGGDRIICYNLMMQNQYDYKKDEGLKLCYTKNIVTPSDNYKIESVVTKAHAGSYGYSYDRITTFYKNYYPVNRFDGPKDNNYFNENDFSSFDFNDLYLILENGKEVKVGGAGYDHNILGC